MSSAHENADLPTVVSETAPSNAFLGNLVEVCIVTEDHRRTMAGLVRLGVGPFRVYTFDDANLADATYRSEPSPFSLKVCFATNRGLTWEIMQPLTGRTIMREFLDTHGEGIHHVAFDCDDAPSDQRVASFAARGFASTQSGRWVDQNSFSFFDTATPKARRPPASRPTTSPRASPSPSPRSGTRAHRTDRGCAKAAAVLGPIHLSRSRGRQTRRD